MQEQPPRLGGIPAGPALAGLLYVLLVGSAVLALWVREFPGAVPVALAKAAPWVFLAFILVFALYRFGLVREGKYPASKAFFQVGSALIFFMLLLPGSRVRYGEHRDPLTDLMLDANPRVRALAAEVAGYRPDGEKYGAELVKALRDPDPKVREEAHASLVRLTGQDLGRPDDPQALKAWGERFR
ncbi:MAG: HEAT repeat domain-containing protein [Myxococcaceae bacterium]